MTGQLFTHYFLTDGIRATPEWQASAADPESFAAFRESVLQRYEALARSADPNEAVTEQDLIRPVLELLGWADYLPQQGTARNEDIPDHLLFADAGSKARASAEANAAARARHAAAVEESKRFGLPLDERDREAGFHARSPHSQILRYLATAEIESESRLRWGLLTNGRRERGPARLPVALPPGSVHAAGEHSRILLRGGPGRGPPLRGAGGPGSLGSGLRERLPGATPGSRRRRREEQGRGRPVGLSDRCRENEVAFGRYRTRELTLAYMNALAAGDAEARVAV